ARCSARSRPPLCRSAARGRAVRRPSARRGCRELRAMRESNDAILVLNAGSSSIKLAVFVEQAGELALELRGVVEGLYTGPRFRAHDATGRVVAEKSWDRASLGHDGAVEYLRDFLPHHLPDRRPGGGGDRG